MTDQPIRIWGAASTRPLDEIESMRCEAPECEIVQEFRALFNEIHRLKAVLSALRQLPTREDMLKEIEWIESGEPELVRKGRQA